LTLDGFELARAVGMARTDARETELRDRPTRSRRDARAMSRVVMHKMLVIGDGMWANGNERGKWAVVPRGARAGGRASGRATRRERWRSERRVWSMATKRNGEDENIIAQASIDAIKARARVRDDELKIGLDDYREKWRVPWSGATVALGIAGWCLSFVGVAAIGFPLALANAHVDPKAFTPTEQAEYLLAVQVAETVVSLSLVYFCVSPHLDVVRDAKNDWFKIDFSAPFEKEKGWAKYGLLGYGTTFLVLAATSLAMEALDKAQSTGAPAAANQIAERAPGTIDGVLPLIQADDPTAFVALLTVTSVLAPLLEEVVFRGFLLASLTKWLPTPGAVLFSSVLFGLAHLAPRDFVELVVLGMVLGFSYARTRNLLTPMLIHSMWNSVVLVVVAAAIKGGFAEELGVPGF